MRVFELDLLFNSGATKTILFEADPSQEADIDTIEIFEEFSVVRVVDLNKVGHCVKMKDVSSFSISIRTL